MPVLILHPDGHTQDVAPEEKSHEMYLVAGEGDLRIRYAEPEGRPTFHFMQGATVPPGTICDPASPAQMRCAFSFPTREAAYAVLDFMLAHLEPGRQPGQLPESVKNDPRYTKPQ